MHIITALVVAIRYLSKDSSHRLTFLYCLKCAAQNLLAILPPPSSIIKYKNILYLSKDQYIALSKAHNSRLLYIYRRVGYIERLADRL
jgi:hypothetical protein